jgi:lipopolysaccharide biosynthesis glycosyltransferase
MKSIKREAMALICAANEKFFPGLLVALGTAVEQATGAFDYDIKVLNGGLTDAQVVMLTEKLISLGVSRGIQVSVDNRILTSEELAILPSRRGSPMANARLLVPQLFPSMAKAVYLDSDVVCSRGVEEFYHALDEDCALSACLDPHQTIKSDRSTRHYAKRDQWNLPYFNSGLIGINVNRWRIDFNKIARLMGSDYEWRHADQSLLNVLYCGQWNCVTPEANICLTLRNCAENDFSQRRANIHYIGPVKPWISQQSAFYRLAVDRLFDEAYQRLSGQSVSMNRVVSGSSLKKARRKGFWYRFFQPGRARFYQLALRKCSDIAGYSS